MPRWPASPFPKASPELSDDELADAIEEWSDEYRTRYPTSLLPELIVALINAASQEQLRREAQSATKLAKISLLVAIGAVIVSLITLVVALMQ